MERNTSHLDRLTVGGAALGQRDVEQLCGSHCIFVKQFVKIAHAVEQQHVGMLCLDAQVLLHHRRMSRHGSRVGRFFICKLDWGEIGFVHKIVNARMALLSYKRRESTKYTCFKRIIAQGANPVSSACIPYAGVIRGLFVKFMRVI